MEQWNSWRDLTPNKSSRRKMKEKYLSMNLLLPSAGMRSFRYAINQYYLKMHSGVLHKICLSGV